MTRLLRRILAVAAVLLIGGFTVGSTTAAAAAAAAAAPHGHSAAAPAHPEGWGVLDPQADAAGLGLRPLYVAAPGGGESAAYWRAHQKQITALLAQSVYTSPLRPLNRWGQSSASSLFSKLDGFFGSQLPAQASRSLGEQFPLTIGNNLMSASSDMARNAVTFDVVDTLGATIGKATQAIAKDVFQTPGMMTILAGGLVVVLLTAMWSARSQGHGVFIRRSLGVLVVAGLLFAMVDASAAGGGTGKNGDYTPAPLTPGWVLQEVNRGISTLANVPAQAFVAGMNSIQQAKTSHGSGNLTCPQYLAGMQTMLSGTEQEASATGSEGMVAVTQIMDQMYAQTGLNAWRMLQTGVNNPYGADVYCRILDVTAANVDPSDSAMLTGYAQSLYGSGGDWSTAMGDGQTAPFHTVSNDDQLRSFIAWAACDPDSVSGGTIHWSWRPGWTGFNTGTAMGKDNAQSSCQTWWTTKPGDDPPGIFDLNGSASSIQSAVKGITNGAEQAHVADYLGSLTGVNSSGGTGIALAYMVGALFSGGAIIFLAVITWVAKLFLAVFAIMLMFVLVAALFRKRPMVDHIVKAFDRFLGLAIFASLLTVIMAVTVMFTRVMMAIGQSLFGGPGNPVTMVWDGLAPAMALVLLHLLFTKVFHIPSPVSVKGAMAWHKAGVSGALGRNAAGAAGGALAGGLMSRRALRRAVHGQGPVGRAGSHALAAATGGRLGTHRKSVLGRKHAMGAPDPHDGVRTGTAAQGGGVQNTAAAAGLPGGVPAAAAAGAGVAAGATAAALTRRQKRELTRAALEHDRATGGAHTVRRDALHSEWAARLSGLRTAAGATQVGQSLAARRARRAALTAARRSGDTAEAARLRRQHTAGANRAAGRVAALLDAPAALTARARLGVHTAAAGVQGLAGRAAGAASGAARAVWNSPRVVGARADAAIMGASAAAAGRYVADSTLGHGFVKVGHAAASVGRGASLTARTVGHAATAGHHRKQAVAAYQEHLRQDAAAKTKAAADAKAAAKAQRKQAKAQFYQAAAAAIGNGQGGGAAASDGGDTDSRAGGND